MTKPDGKHRKQKKSGPARKAAKVGQQKGNILRRIFKRIYAGPEN